MRCPGTLVVATCTFSLIGTCCSFLHASSLSGVRRTEHGARTATSVHRLRRGSCSRRPATTTAAATAEDDVLLTFRPSGIEVVCKPGEVALDVAQRCSGMVEDNKNPFCRDGGCYNCEVEVVEAMELGIEDNLVRACLFKVPEGAKSITLVQMNGEEAFEDMI
eukprot:jgi/Undpi1/962/HiC_scaffold_10.g04426.m1